MTNFNCPICDERYADIAACDDVCETHSDWVVTRCYICGTTVFSDSPGICVRCIPYASKRILKTVSKQNIKDLKALGFD